MKNLTYFALLALALMGCSGRRANVESNVSSYVKQQLNDPGSYQAVSFEMDTITVFVADSPEFKRMIDDFSADLSDFDREDFVHRLISYQASNGDVLAGVSESVKTPLRISEAFMGTMRIANFWFWYGAKNGAAYRVPEKPVGYKITHIYRANNQYGALVKQEAVLLTDLQGHVNSSSED